jgi:hypothetical protein
MRSCDGIFSVNWGGALLAQQEWGSQVRSLTHKRWKSRAAARHTAEVQRLTRMRDKKSATGFRWGARNFFLAAGQSSSVSCLTTLARRRRKKIEKFFGAQKISTEAVENFWIT